MGGRPASPRASVGVYPERTGLRVGGADPNTTSQRDLLGFVLDKSPRYGTHLGEGCGFKKGERESLFPDDLGNPHFREFIQVRSCDTCHPTTFVQQGLDFMVPPRPPHSSSPHQFLARLLLLFAQRAACLILRTYLAPCHLLPSTLTQVLQ